MQLQDKVQRKFARTDRHDQLTANLPQLKVNRKAPPLNDRTMSARSVPPNLTGKLLELAQFKQTDQSENADVLLELVQLSRPILFLTTERTI